MLVDIFLFYPAASANLFERHYSTMTISPQFKVYQPKRDFDKGIFYAFLLKFAENSRLTLITWLAEKDQGWQTVAE